MADTFHETWQNVKLGVSLLSNIPQQHISLELHRKYSDHLTVGLSLLSMVGKIPVVKTVRNPHEYIC